MNNDPASTDVSSLVDDMRNHRFDGYSANRVANEIDWFRSGAGTGSINDAVDALDRVAAALTDTEHTLRSELDKLGVSWNSAGSEGAFQEFGEQAGFSDDMADTLRDVSRVLYEQGDAFNRTRDQLPDSEEVRKAMGGRSVGDDAARMLGFETDHASKVAEGAEAREHAVQLLNEYVTTSGNGLGSLVDTLVPDVPEFGVNTPSPGSDAGADGGDDGSSAVDTLMPTGSEGSAAAGAGPGGAASGTGAPAAVGPQSVPAGDGQGPVASSGTTTSGVVSSGGVVPSGGVGEQPVAGVAAGIPGAGASSHDSGPSAPGGAAGGDRGVPGAGGPGYGGSGYGASGYAAGAGPQYGHTPSGHTQAGGGGQLRGASGDVAESGTSGRGLGRMVSGAGEQVSGGAPGTRSYAPLSPVDSGNTTQQPPLAKGNMSGVGPQAPAAAGAVDGGSPPGPKPGVRSADVGAGAAALGAGGTAGAMSTGEQHGRGVGRSAPNAGDGERAVPFGAGPDEQAAAARGVDGDSARYRDGGLLQRATGGDDADEHTRSFGVDHTDLFADDRLVSPERIDAGEADYSDGGH